jgi:DDE superfamily endonuclease/Transposase
LTPSSGHGRGGVPKKKNVRPGPDIWTGTGASHERSCDRWEKFIFGVNFTRLTTMTICNAKRTAITRLLNKGIGIEKVCEVMEVSRSSVFRFKKPAAPKCKSKPGTKRKTTAEIDAFIVETSEKNRKLLPREIKGMVEDKFGVTLGLTQLKRRLIDAGLHGRVCARKPLLRPINKAKRLLWAFQHRNWTVEQWKKVLWSDEKKFELYNTKRRQYCRKRNNEPYRDDTIQGTVKGGGGSLMVWGCVGNNVTGSLVKIEGIMTQQVYKDILQNAALPSGGKIYSSENWIFQEDNDPKHSSKLCRSFLEKEANTNGFEVLKWPPQSPDLSPIELLWDEADRQVQKKHPTNVTQLEAIVREVWDGMKEEAVEKIVSRMPILCQAVIKAGGGYFDEKLTAIKKQTLYNGKKTCV